ncbi:ABC transporter transmembrane domain-containing protein [Sinorhizobium meliloti]|nr:ABC transporter transmembrane domain-containing protein [Sinorhizobium meliloti]WKL42310.1 ABC transporter transmembrane domain-containing protein [Sinorhizobium meliloti]
MPILRSLLIDYWRDARGITVLVIAATLVGAVASVAAPYLFSRAIDDLTLGRGAGEGLQIFLIYALLFGAAAAFGQASRFLIFLCAVRLCFIANLAFFSRLLRKTHAFFLDHNPAAIGTAGAGGRADTQHHHAARDRRSPARCRTNCSQRRPSWTSGELGTRVDRPWLRSHRYCSGLCTGRARQTVPRRGDGTQSRERQPRR